MSDPALTHQALDALDRHLSYWEYIGSELHGEGLLAFLRSYSDTKGWPTHALVGAVNQFTAWEEEVWNRAPTILLDPNVHAFVVEAAETMPDAPLHPKSIPAPSGVVMMPDFGSMLDYTMEVERELGMEELPVVAIAWNVRDDVGVRTTTGAVSYETHQDWAKGGVDIWLYTDIERMAPDHADQVDPAMRRQPFITDRVPWAFGVPWRDNKVAKPRQTAGWYTDEDGNLLADPHVARLRRFLLALWAFMSEEIIVTPNTHLPRPNRRRLERSGRMAEIPDDGFLRIAQLRSVRYVDEDGNEREPEDGEERDAPFWSHRWFVRPHWRRLGDGRVIPVRGYIKGPENRPLVMKHNVMAVRR